jgi:hypothetical protein
MPGLAAALASPNAPPTVNGQHIEYPDGYDAKAQERVRAAEQELKRRGVGAFPCLIEHLDDAHYSYSEYYGQWRNNSVGEICYYIIEDQVEPDGCDYTKREAAGGKTVEKPWYIYTTHLNGHLRNWWKERSGRTLRELQIEALQWEIEQERKLGFKDKPQEETILGPMLKRLAELTSPP